MGCEDVGRGLCGPRGAGVQDLDEPLASMLQMQTCSSCPEAMGRLCDLERDIAITLLRCGAEQPACMQQRVKGGSVHQIGDLRLEGIVSFGTQSLEVLSMEWQGCYVQVIASEMLTTGTRCASGA